MHTPTSQPRPTPCRPRALTLIAALASLMLLLGACQSAAQLVPDPAEAPAVEQPAKLTGSLSYTNDILTAYHARHAVALVDMHGFVVRDETWPIRAHTLVFGSLTLDKKQAYGFSRLPGAIVVGH